MSVVYQRGPRPENRVAILPPEALKAWAEYDPAEAHHESARVRHAFMSGFLAGRKTT